MKELNFVEYQQKSKRTMVNLSLKLDLSHMVLGMLSEIKELSDAIKNRDKVNAQEEIADFYWYLSNYYTIRGLKFEDLELDKDLKNIYVPDLFLDLYNEISELSDFSKKFIAYDKPIDEIKEKEHLKNIDLKLKEISLVLEIDIYNGLYKNIKKLEERFPDKFDKNLAINRNTENERRILED